MAVKASYPYIGAMTPGASAKTSYPYIGAMVPDSAAAAGLSVLIKVAGSLRTATPQIKVDGSWRAIPSGIIKVDGSWRAIT